MGEVAVSEESESVEEQPEAEAAGETSETSAPETPTTSDTQTTSESKKEAEQARLSKTFRLIPGEDVLLTKRPSVFAFIPMYVVGILSLGIHFLFNRAGSMASDNFALDLLYAAMDLDFNETLPIGFVFTMILLAWLNRLLNVSTSGRWVTVYLLIVAITPIIIQIDYVVSLIAGDSYDELIPIDYSYTLFGMLYFAIFMGLTYYYQRSFHYAITSDAVIFEHSFLLSRSHRRILFDRISEVLVERTPIGTLVGFATVTILTDSGVGIVEENTGSSIPNSIPGTQENANDTNVEKAGKGIIRSVLGLLTYQRTIRTVRPDPKHCMYNIQNWEKAKLLLNEMHKKNSQSHLLSDLKKTMEASTKD